MLAAERLGPFGLKSMRIGGSGGSYDGLGPSEIRVRMRSAAPLAPMFIPLPQARYYSKMVIYILVALQNKVFGKQHAHGFVSRVQVSMPADELPSSPVPDLTHV